MGSLNNLSKNILKRGWVNAKIVRRGNGYVTPCPPSENFNRTPSMARIKIGDRFLNSVHAEG